ncbi:bromodomain-containing protein 4-like [Anopheles arabiensis]|uniref:bromodomain-containing protein 4-like n=1 Tax=Anopheles arabiensis TaxID=7173 RepID=UPI001AAE0714|nr:bromodomain-containing protein 4-like [Anopheles arabiensis]
MQVASLEMIHTHFGPASVDNYQPQTLYQQQQKRKQQEQQHQPSQQQQQKQQDQLHPQQEEQQQQEQQQQQKQQQQEEEHHHSQQQQQQQKQQEEEQQQHISTIICNPPPSIISTSNGTTMCVAKLMIGLDHAPPAFNVRSRVLGDGGTNLNYIRTETGAIVTLRGRGSLNLEPQTMQEAPEPLHLFIEHPLLDGLQNAKQLAKNLIETLQEELSFFQENTIPKANFRLMPQPSIVQTNQVAQMPPIIRTQHVTQPNGIIHQPPPTVLGPPLPSFVQHPPALQQSQPPPPQIIQQPPTIIQSHVPLQIHQQPSNVVISQIQTTAPQSQIPNVSNPPPGTQIRPIVQIKNTPAGTHLTQPPPSIQIQQAPPEAAQQIIVNPAPPYQVQYIQQNPSLQTASGPHSSGQVTIQHLIQPQSQPVQGIVQTTIPPPQFDHFQRPPQTQQIITVQGSTAFMVPPPNIIHQTAPQTPNQIIFQTQQPILTHPPPELTPLGPQAGIILNGAEAKKVVGSTEIKIKPEPMKLDDGPSTGAILQQIPTNSQLAKTTVIPVSSIAGIPISQPPPPIMSVPPPTVQHIVGNTIITSQPNPPISHGGISQQIFSQIPVSIQSFTPATPPQQLQVSGSHFVVSAPQAWPVVTASAAGQQIQQLPVSTVPSIQITTQPMRNPNEIHIISQPTIISAAEYRPPASQQQQIIANSSFNPQIQPPQGVQVQFHTVPPPPQQIITSLGNAQIQHPPQAPQSQLIENQRAPQHQIIINASIPPQPPPPPPFTAVQYSAQEVSKPNVEQLQRPPPTPHPPHKQLRHNINTQTKPHAMLRPGQKRKISDEDVNKLMPPKIGLGTIFSEKSPD